MKRNVGKRMLAVLLLCTLVFIPVLSGCGKEAKKNTKPGVTFDLNLYICQ